MLLFFIKTLMNVDKIFHIVLVETTYLLNLFKNILRIGPYMQL